MSPQNEKPLNASCILVDTHSTRLTAVGRSLSQTTQPRDLTNNHSKSLERYCPPPRPNSWKAIGVAAGAEAGLLVKELQQHQQSIHAHLLQRQMAADRTEDSLWDMSRRLRCAFLSSRIRCQKRSCGLLSGIGLGPGTMLTFELRWKLYTRKVAGEISSHSCCTAVLGCTRSRCRVSSRFCLNFLRSPSLGKPPIREQVAHPRTILLGTGVDRPFACDVCTHRTTLVFSPILWHASNRWSVWNPT